MSKTAFCSAHLAQSVRSITEAKRAGIHDDVKADNLASAIAKIRLACDVADLDYYAIERDSYQLYLASKITEQR
jgi:hypothetical protein